jgi:hypothetical protein
MRWKTQRVWVQYENRTPMNPFLSVKSGCYIDTDAFDTVSLDSCINETPVVFTPSGTEVYFNVGETLNAGSYIFDTGGWDVVWSGDCNGVGITCILNVPYTPVTSTRTAIATVKHLVSGMEQTYTVNATVESGF